jgi:hypothetical protein
LQRDERLEHGSGVVLALAGKEGGQRVDDDEVDGAFRVETGDAFNEIAPVGGGRFAGERTAEPAGMIAEIQTAAAELSEFARLFGDDDGPAGGESEAGQFAACPELGQEDGDESRFAGLPLACEER